MQVDAMSAERRREEGQPIAQKGTDSPSVVAIHAVFDKFDNSGANHIEALCCVCLSVCLSVCLCMFAGVLACVLVRVPACVRLSE